MYRDELAKLSKEALIALGLTQSAQIEELTRRIAELEAKLGGPPKTPDNSSTPPRKRANPTAPSAARRKSARAVPGCAGHSRPIRTGSSTAWRNAARTASTR